jgi:hypothetical protein
LRESYSYHLGMINSWMNFPLRIIPYTVEIDTSKIASS